jgi:hypothetical protein
MVAQSNMLMDQIWELIAQQTDANVALNATVGALISILAHSEGADELLEWVIKLVRSELPKARYYYAVLRDDTDVPGPTKKRRGKKNRSKGLGEALKR